MRPLRLCLFSDGLWPYASGVATAVSQHALSLTALGHQVAIFGPPLSKRIRPTERPRGIHIERTAIGVPHPTLAGLTLTLPTFLRAVRFVRHWRPDVIHIYTEGGVGLEGLYAAKRAGVPTVGHFSTLFGDASYTTSYLPTWLPSISPIIWRYQLALLGSCDEVIAPSEPIRSILTLKGLRRPITTVSFGAREPTVPFPESVPEIRQQHNCEHGLHLIYVGRVAKEKEIPELLKIFEVVAPKHPATKLIILGAGNASRKVLSLANESGYGSRIILLGAVSHDELYERGLYRLGDIYVTTSRSETEGIAVLEALAHGLPVVAYASCGILENVLHGVNGLLAPPGEMDAFISNVDTLLSDWRRLESMRTAARVSGQRRSSRQSSTELIAVYRRLLDGTRGD